jgi:hypothetical protein
MAADSAATPVYAFEGFTALPLAYYAGVDGDAIRIRPVGAVAALDREGWFVARDSAWPGAAEWRTPAAALQAAGWEVTDSVIATAPRQRIAAYRFARSAPSR